MSNTVRSQITIFFNRALSRMKSAASDELLLNLLQLIAAFRFQDAHIALINELNELDENELFDRLHHHKKTSNDSQRCLKESVRTSFPKIIKLRCNAFILKIFYRIDLNQERSTS